MKSSRLIAPLPDPCPRCACEHGHSHRKRDVTPALRASALNHQHVSESLAATSNGMGHADLPRTHAPNPESAQCTRPSERLGAVNGPSSFKLRSRPGRASSRNQSRPICPDSGGRTFNRSRTRTKHARALGGKCRHTPVRGSVRAETRKRARMARVRASAISRGRTFTLRLGAARAKGEANRPRSAR